MNNLEKEIYRQILKSEGIEDKAYEEANPISAGICRLHAIHAAGIAMKWIEKGLREASADTFSNSKGLMVKVQDYYVKTWFEENGLTPTEPDTKEPK